MPYIVIADELDEDEATLVAKNCGSTYVGHMCLLSYANGEAKFEGNSANNYLLESICLISKFQNRELKSITAVEVDGAIKSALQLQIKYTERFLGEADESLFQTNLEHTAINHLSRDLKLVMKLKEIGFDKDDAMNLDKISFAVEDIKVKKSLYSVSEPLMNWESFIDECVERLSDKACHIDLYKS